MRLSRFMTVLDSVFSELYVYWRIDTEKQSSKIFYTFVKDLLVSIRSIWRDRWKLSHVKSIIKARVWNVGCACLLCAENIIIDSNKGYSQYMLHPLHYLSNS